MSARNFLVILIWLAVLGALFLVAGMVLQKAGQQVQQSLK